MTTKKDKIEDWITKMQIKWETNDNFRLPEVIYETYQKAIQSQKQKIIEEIEKCKVISYPLNQNLIKKEEILKVLGERFVKEESKGWLDIPELGISVEIEVHDKNKSWDDLKLKDKEDELLTAEQCIFLANSKYAKQLKMDGSSSHDDFFIKQPFDLSRKNGYVARFCANSGCAYLYCGWDSVGSNSYIGVRFVRKKISSDKLR